ncbi:MAG: hypothetical protein AMJ62_06180 [Myxococcales bacterium SG8_38]|nr:MAG: hypothetical protein AMJ62_06180 [Myxococcales bacterium SG8_38]
MIHRLAWAIAAALLLTAHQGLAQEPDIHLEGTVPEGPETHFFVEFEVPERIVEIEVRHDNLSPGNILDWGLDDPNGFRGWGGGNHESAIVGIDAASRSYVPGPIVAGTWSVVVGKAQIEETPARYEIDIFLRTVATLEPQPRAPYEDPGVLDEEERWYAGDFHVHTEESGDATPTIAEALSFAQGVGLDFVMLSEHNTNSGLTLYADAQPDFPNLLIVPGVEWTTYAGHANALGATDWVDHKIGVGGLTAADAIQAYKDQGALFSINHPRSPGAPICIGCRWEIAVDPTTIDGVEVQSGILRAVPYWDDLCAQGSHAAALGGSDDHRAGQGTSLTDSPIGTPTTMVFASELSVHAILEGVRSGRTVVKVNGPESAMIETELTGERVEDTVFADTATLSAVVTNGDGKDLQLIRNGEVIETLAIDSDPFTHERSVQAPEEGEDRYRYQVTIEGLPDTVGSYVWLRTPEPSDSSGCSCRVRSDSDSDMAFAFGALLLGVCVWRRRRQA